MSKLFFTCCIFISFSAMAQVDSSTNKLMNELDNKAAKPQGKTPVKVFLAQRLINANTVETLQKGHFEFKVVHNFGDASGRNGGIRSAFGLDGSVDIKIAFLYGITKNLNVIVSRNKGDGQVFTLWELGFKYKLLEQRENDPSHPVSLALFANGVSSSQRSSTDSTRENYYRKTSDRQSQTLQLMIARKFGKILSLQLNPTYVHTNYVIKNDVPNIFAMGAAIRVPIYKSFVFIADYFHPFRPQSTIDSFKLKGINFYDVLGVGLELVTPGHIFHVNFTNTTNILENRFIPRTTTSWKKGQYRWGFTVTRDFVIRRNKNKK
ncbi:MAG: hypothetical protein IPP81_08090 [Chitinophagaceae bacterium]|nr:hypothetical protein [Chitinophagaceae bacterium]